jgi:hypothetical protein
VGRSLAEALGERPAGDLPERYVAPRLESFEGVMPEEWLGALGDWLKQQRGRFKIAASEGRWAWDYANVDADLPGIALLKRAVLDRLGSGLEALGVEPFEVAHVETHATLYHHGGHFVSHDDLVDDVDRRVGFALFVHSTPKMFDGGEMEFPDGTAVAPTHNRLVMYDPAQRHAVRKVECWSADFLHGRWAVSGFVQA